MFEEKVQAIFQNKEFKKYAYVAIIIGGVYVVSKAINLYLDSKIKRQQIKINKQRLIVNQNLIQKENI